MKDRLVVVCDDLLFWARIQGAAKAASTTAVRVWDSAGMEAALAAGDVGRVLVDLGSRSLDALDWAPRWKALPRPPELVAFGSHMDAAALARARAAGFDRVMARSRFVEELASLV